jgi:HSP20 family protein
MHVERMKVAPDTVAYADGERHKLIVEFAIPGAPTETIDVKILEDSVHLLAPARDIEYVSALALGWPVKPDKAEATYENGLLRIEVPFKDPMEDAVKVAIKAGGTETKTKSIEGTVKAAADAASRPLDSWQTSQRGRLLDAARSLILERGGAMSKEERSQMRPRCEADVAMTSVWNWPQLILEATFNAFATEWMFRLSQNDWIDEVCMANSTIH